MKWQVIAGAGLVLSSCIAIAIIKLDPRDTEVWDPVPAVVTADPNQPPSDAVVLLGDTDDTFAWQAVSGGDMPWSVADGVLTVEPGTGDIRTREHFCDMQLHIEWRVPEPEPDMDGQARNNSGVFLQERYEIQVLDSWQNRTYSNGQAGAVYKQTMPLVNATRPPGQWQVYDIVYRAPRFESEQVIEPAHVTVLHNGVVIHHYTEIKGNTVFIGEPEYEAHTCAPLRLQDHRDRVSYRNIWVRPL